MAKVELETHDPYFGKQSFDYPSNSNKSKAEEKEKKLKPVVNGGVTVKKQSLGRKFAQNFLSDDMQNIKTYIFSDVIVPTIKDVIWSIITGSVSMALFHEVRSGKSRGRNDTYVSYDRYYDRGGRSKETRERERTRSGTNDIIFDSKGDAEEVLSAMVDLIDEFGSASVSDLYQIIGRPDSFVDNDFGWKNLSNGSVKRVSEGYLLDLPRPISLK